MKSVFKFLLGVHGLPPRKHQAFFLISLALTALLTFGSISHPAKAAVLWDTNSLKLVEDPPGNRYIYAPSVVVDGNTEHVWSCYSEFDNTFKDSIYYFRRVNGTIVERKVVLRASANGWDKVHVCDPVVVGGKFNYSGTTYNYAMFYLGNDVDASAHNQLGVAFANDLAANEWIKYPQPIVPFPANTDNSYWGVGQASVTAVDSNGRLLIFYRQDDASGTKEYRRDVNLNNMSNPVIGNAVQLSNAGLGGDVNFLVNVDLVYDGSRDRFYAFRDRSYSSVSPTYVSVSVDIVSIEGQYIWGGGGTWRTEGIIDTALTGFARNHNGSIKRNVWGGLPSSNTLEIMFADSCAGSACSSNPEWSYDLWELKGTLNNDPLPTATASPVMFGNLGEVYNPSGNVFSYAPSVVIDGSTEHIWACQNKTAGNVQRSIFYSRRVNGSIVETKEVLPVGASGTWDSNMVCDPAVVGGAFNYNGTQYNYAMLYQGSSGAQNQIGVAFSNDLAASNWVKYPNPVVTYGNGSYWGVGQPSATAVSGGRMLLFYTQGDNNGTVAYRRDVNLGNMSSPTIGDAVQLSTSGLTGTDGSGDYLNNYDIVFDSSRNRFYAVREQHPYPTDNPSYIGTSLQVVSIAEANIWGGGGTWRVEGVINPALTNFARNHNGGVKRNIWGGLPNSSEIQIVFARSCANCGTAEWSYDLWQAKGTLTAGDALINTTTTPTPKTTRPDMVGIYKEGTFHLRVAGKIGYGDLFVTFGEASGQLPVTGDWNGDGVDTVGVYDTHDGVFNLRDTNATGYADYTFVFGSAGDVPLAGRWNISLTRDGVGVYRISNGIFYQRESLSSGIADQWGIFGTPGDVPVTGDWDGDGVDSIGVYRASEGSWYLSNGTLQGILFADTVVRWSGSSHHIPIVGDWSGIGQSSIGFYDSAGSFALRQSGLTDIGVSSVTVGTGSGVPVAGKWSSVPAAANLNSILVAGSLTGGNENGSSQGAD
jgi:hypothetical protein